MNGKKKNKSIDSNIQLLLSHKEEIHPLAHKLAQQAKSLKDIKYIPLPSNKVNLTINDHYVNADVNKIVKKCYHSTHARKFLQEKYEWKDSTIDNIWWNVHAKAIQQHSFFS